MKQKSKKNKALYNPLMHSQIKKIFEDVKKEFQKHFIETHKYILPITE